MTARSLILSVSVGVLACALGLEWFALRSAREAESSLRELARQQAAVNAGLVRARARLADSARDVTQLRTALGGAPVDRGAPSAAAVASGDDPELAARLAANPELFALGVRVYRANLRLHYGLLYQSLGLSPAAIEKFEDLMTAHQEEELDLNAAATARGLAVSDPAVVGLRDQSDAQLRAAQAALLGTAGYQQLLQINRAQPVEDIVTNVATTVALTASPLTAAQAGQLTRFLAEASSNYQSGDAADPSTINWDLVLSQAQGVLTREQYEALQSEYLKPQLDKMHQQFNQYESAKK